MSTRERVTPIGRTPTDRASTDRTSIERNAPAPSPLAYDGASGAEVVDIALARMRTGSVVRERRVRWAKGIGAIGVALALLVFLGSRDLLHREPRSVVGVDGAVEVVLRQNTEGHYFVRGTIDDVTVGFLLDTGATNVAIPADVADRLGLKRGMPVKTHTANGIATSYRTRIGTLSIGGIERRHVEATISPGLAGGSILLGMSFLRDLTLEQRDGRLTLRD